MSQADERTRIMLDATPLCCNYWDESHNIVECNQEAVNLFGLSSKQEYLERFFDLSPEFQPCGRRSQDMAHEYIDQAFAAGRIQFEWMHQNLQGEPLPCEITLVRVDRGEGYVVVSFTRDLRELKATQARADQAHEADERTRIMFESMPLCCSLWDKDTRPVDCNQETLDLFGLKNRKEYLEKFFELSPERQPCGRLSIDMFVEQNRQAFETGRIDFEWVHQTLGGEPIPVEVTLVCAKREKGDFIVSYVRDLREIKASLAEMREANERTQIMLDATPLCCNFWDENFNNIDCNQEAVNLFELKDKQEYLDRFFELSPEYQPCGRPTQEMAMEYIREAFATGRVRFEWMHQKLGGEPVPAEITLVRVKRGDKFIVAGYTRDLRELKETVNVVNRLEKLAFTDNLTGVFNRHYFKEHVAQEFLKHLGDKVPSCIIMFDIDHFKRVNDTYGHSAGDIILRGVAQKVQAVLRSSDLLARYGGEEFVIYVANAPLGATLRLAERIRKAVEESVFTYEGDDIKVTISLGVADQSLAGTSFEKFVTLADDALYKAKDNGRNRVESVS